MKTFAKILLALALVASASAQVAVQRLTDGTFNLMTAIGIAPGQVETVSGTITGSGPIGTTATISGGTISGTIVASSLSTSGNLTVAGTGTITGSAVLGGAATVSGALTASGSSTFASGATVTGSAVTQTLSSTRFTDSGLFVVSGSSTLATLSATTASVSSLTSSGPILVSSTASGVGYGTGSGSTVSQTTSKSNAVVLNAPSGQITLSSYSLASATIITFTLSNSAIASYDTPIVCVSSGGTLGAYGVKVASVGTGSASIAIKNDTAGTLSESPVISFNIIKGSSN